MIGTQSVISNMKKNKSGSIINISSIFGIIGSARDLLLTMLQKVHQEFLQKQ